MDEIKALFKAASTDYNRLRPHADSTLALLVSAHGKLAREAELTEYGQYAGRPAVTYSAFFVGRETSRPVRGDLYIAAPAEFAAKFRTLREALRLGPATWEDAEKSLANAVVYTSVMAVACAYDLWQRGSRKTPGTTFEIIMAALFQEMLPDAVFSKHIALTELLHDGDVDAAAEEEVDPAPVEDGDGPGSVSTDLVIRRTNDANTGVVLPLKITTRERIVQPFAHQRILDSAFGPNRYSSLLVCISETQLDDKTKTVKQVCVPGTVKLFQKYLAPLGGLYYCDVPQRYAAPDMQRVVPVRSLGDLFGDVADLLAR